uniref:Uncharacterized protein n=1 Tax=Janibacter limosus TaxID=53458 RepID=A0AC61U387_9MICO|nr:hypothetical protein [Janibacter limosus]
MSQDPYDDLDPARSRRRRSIITFAIVLLMLFFAARVRPVLHPRRRRPDRPDRLVDDAELTLDLRHLAEAGRGQRLQRDRP